MSQPYAIMLDRKSWLPWKNSRQFAKQSDFVHELESLIQNGEPFTTRVAKEHGEAIAKRISSFLKKSRIGLKLESHSNPEALQIVANAFGFGALVSGLGVVAVIGGKFLLKKAAQRAALVAIPGGQLIAVAATAVEVVDTAVRWPYIVGAISGGALGIAAGVSASYWKVTIDFEYGNTDSLEMRFQPGNA